MKKQICGVKVYQLAIVLGLSLLAILIGTFLDLQISEKIVKAGNAFGKIIAIIGKYPGYLLLGTSGVLFFIGRKDKTSTSNQAISWIILVIVTATAGALYGYDDLSSAVSSKTLAIAIGIVTVAAGEGGMYYLFRHAEAEESINASLTFFFAIVLTFVLTFLLKSATSRPRFSYLLSTDNLEGYQPWYSFSSALKSSSPDAEADSFASWPSGHSALASATILVCLLPRLNDKLKGKENYFFIGTLAWSLIVAIGRLSDGSHFLSDVGWGSLIGIVVPLIVGMLIYPNGGKETIAKTIQETSQPAPAVAYAPAPSEEPEEPAREKKPLFGKHKSKKDKNDGGFDIDV